MFLFPGRYNSINLQQNHNRTIATSNEISPQNDKNSNTDHSSRHYRPIPPTGRRGLIQEFTNSSIKGNTANKTLPTTKMLNDEGVSHDATSSSQTQEATGIDSDIGRFVNEYNI